VITEALRVLLVGVLGVFLVMALIYLVIVTLSRIRVTNAGATESNPMDGLVAVSDQPNDVRQAGAAEPIGDDGIAAENMAAADEWYEYYEDDSEISEHGYEFSKPGVEFDGVDEYEYVIEKYYPDSEFDDADEYADAEESSSAQIEEIKS